MSPSKIQIFPQVIVTALHSSALYSLSPLPLSLSSPQVQFGETFNNFSRIDIYFGGHAPPPYLYSEISEIRDLDLHLLVLLTLGIRPPTQINQ